MLPATYQSERVGTKKSLSIIILGFTKASYECDVVTKRHETILNDFPSEL
jgi:hypothetical protein